MFKSIQRLLGLPVSTSTEKLMPLGMHNTISQVIEAPKTAQLMRLSPSRDGRRILESIGCSPTVVGERKVSISPSDRNMLQVDPFHRVVQPQYNGGRRKARARSFWNSITSSPELASFDYAAAHYGHSDYFVAVAVDHRGRLLKSASVRKVPAAVAE